VCIYKKELSGALKQIFILGQDFSSMQQPIFITGAKQLVFV